MRTLQKGKMLVSLFLVLFIFSTPSAAQGAFTLKFADVTAIITRTEVRIFSGDTGLTVSQGSGGGSDQIFGIAPTASWNPVLTIQENSPVVDVAAFAVRNGEDVYLGVGSFTSQEVSFGKVPSFRIRIPFAHMLWKTSRSSIERLSWSPNTRYLAVDFIPEKGTHFVKLFDLLKKEEIKLPYFFQDRGTSDMRWTESGRLTFRIRPGKLGYGEFIGFDPATGNAFQVIE